MQKQTNPIIDLGKISQEADKAAAQLIRAAGDRLRETSPAWLGRLSDQKWDAGSLTAYVRLKQNGEETTARYPPDAPVAIFEFDLPVRVKQIEGGLEIVGVNSNEGASFFEGQLPANALSNLPLVTTQEIAGFYNSLIAPADKLGAPTCSLQYAQIVPSSTMVLTNEALGQGSLTIPADTLSVGNAFEIDFFGTYQTPIADTIDIILIVLSPGPAFADFNHLLPAASNQPYRVSICGCLISALSCAISIQGVFPMAAPSVQLSPIQVVPLNIASDTTFQINANFSISGANRFTANTILVKIYR